MKRTIFLIAVVLGAMILASPAKAGDQEHKFFRNDFDKTHCWPSLTSNMRAAPALTMTTPGQVAAGKSPGITLLGENVSPMDFDPQLAVSPKYLLVLEAHSYVFYDRATNAPLTADGCVPINAEFTDLFAPLLLPTDPVTNAKNDADISYHLEFGRQPTFPCDPVHWKDPPSGNPPSGCIQGNYDARAYYDANAGHFWILAAARNHVWRCPNSNPCSDEARRYVFVAVSKDQDPRNGFWEYVLVRDYADWPLFSVRNDRLLIAHKDGKRLFVFDAKKLAEGTSIDPFLGQYLDDKFSEVNEISPITQYSDADGLSLVLGKSGKDLTLFVFKDPTKPLVKSSLTLKTTPSWHMQPVYRNGKFYFTDAFQEDPCDEDCPRYFVDVHRVTATLASSPLSATLTQDESFVLQPSDANLRMSGVMVESNGAVIAWYQYFPTDGSPQQARYQVLYANESNFRDGAILRSSDTAAPNPEKFISDQQLGGAVEPSGKVAFWITHLYRDSNGTKLQTVGKVEPGCGTLALCGSTCADLSTDHSNCGKCDHSCDAKQQCSNKVCKSPPCGGANLMSDPKNCGACKHVCPEGKCVSGECCELCHCQDGHTASVCQESTACYHICLGHEPH